MPKAMTIIPSVAMNGGTWSLATTTPLMAPRNVVTATATRMGRMSGRAGRSGKNSRE